MTMIVDAHCHLTDEKFENDRDEIIRNFNANKMEFVVLPGDTLSSSKEACLLSEKYDRIYCAVGLHPHEAKDYNFSVEEELTQFIKKYPKVIAIGEIGLDYYYDYSPREVQKDVFRKQLDLAYRYHLPVIIHSRDAMQDTYEILKEYSGKVKGVLHSYSGSVEMAKAFITLGYFISLSGTVTFKNARVAKEVAQAISLDHLMIETDSPYLTPEPFRGKRNEPKLVRLVAEKISEIKDIPVSLVIKRTTENAKTCFNIC